MGDHLHLSMHNALRSGPFVTFPVAYNDYFERPSRQSPWTYVARGVPQLGQQVMRLSPVWTLLLRAWSRLRRFVARA